MTYPFHQPCKIFNSRTVKNVFFFIRTNYKTTNINSTKKNIFGLSVVCTSPLVEYLDSGIFYKRFFTCCEYTTQTVAPLPPPLLKMSLRHCVIFFKFASFIYQYLFVEKNLTRLATNIVRGFYQESILKMRQIKMWQTAQCA